MENLDLSKYIANFLSANKFTNVELYALKNKTNLSEYIIFATSSNILSAKQYISNLIENIKTNYNISCLKKDGFNKGEWIVLDYNKIIIHVLTKDLRLKYNLEKLYKDGKNSVDFTEVGD